MQLASEPISPMYEEWRFVTDDTQHISEAVREQDADCRLAWNPSTQRFGLFRWAAVDGVGQAWLCGRELRTIRGSADPDRRVIHEMQEADIFRRRRPELFYRAMRDLLRIDEERKRTAAREHFREASEPAAFAIRKEAGVTDRAFVPDTAATERVVGKR